MIARGLASDARGGHAEAPQEVHRERSFHGTGDTHASLDDNAPPRDPAEAAETPTFAPDVCASVATTPPSPDPVSRDSQPRATLEDAARAGTGAAFAPRPLRQRWRQMRVSAEPDHAE